MKSKRLLWIILFCVMGIGAVVFYFDALPNARDKRGMNADVPSLDESQLKNIVESRNLGVAYLENHDWQLAEEEFQKIIKRLPESRSALTNLAIAQTEFVINLDTNAAAAELTAAVENALATLLQLREVAPQDPVSYRLQARVAAKRSQIAEAVDLLTEAASLAPDDPTIWYEIYQNSQSSREPATVAAGEAAIEKLHELAPDNVFAFMQWMVVQAQAENPPLDQIVDELEGLITPLAAGIEKRSTYNVLTFVERVKQAVNDGNVAAARAGLMPLKNIITPDPVAQSDLKRLEVDSLEFVSLKFSEGIEEQLAALRAENEPPSEVRFVQLPTAVSHSAPIKHLELVDFNLDRSLDLLVLSEGEITLYGREKSTGGWKPEFAYDVAGDYDALIAADLDYDRIEAKAGAADDPLLRQTTDLDVVLFGQSGLTFLKTNLSALGGQLEFEAVALPESLQTLVDVSAVVPADLNNDGDLDLAVIASGKLLYLNNQGNFEFVEIPLESELAERTAIDCIALDWDRDIDIDLIVLLADGTVGVLESYRHGTFVWRPFAASSQPNLPQTLDVADVDRNGSWDVLVGGQEGIELFLTRLPQTGEVQLLRAEIVGDNSSYRISTADLNSDGYRDLLSASIDSIHLDLGNQNGTFSPLESLAVASVRPASSFAVGDFDDDGDDDIVLAAEDQIQFYQGDAAASNHWLDVGLIAAHVEDKNAANSQRINYYGYGSTIEIRTGAEFQQLFVRSPYSRFGLGENAQADAVRVIWTNGIPQNIVQPNADQVVWEEQKLTGSCPYLYAWNGERFEFVTDLLWASPLGLQSPTGDLVPYRPWEYLKVSGESLVARDGKYVLQITEELWETAYFDQVELIAIDHPEEVDIYSNEKVGPPSIAEYRIHQVKQERLPKSVVNQVNHDLLPAVRQEDGRFAKPFTRKLTQGYTDDSFIEIDFGLTEKPDALTLFLTGWMHPTDTGLNVAIHENSQWSGPAAPSIWAPDERGEFVKVVPYCGFPGGKTKTIVIELSDVFPTQDYRIRLATSMELYWDHIFFSTEKISSDPVSHTLNCTKADLHDRGVSALEYSQHHGPEAFHYDRVSTVPPWPAIDGNFTRYGDVLELVQTSDHKLVVMGAGDEMTLEFSVPEKPLPDGWKRDFILHNVGWDKDANLHTITGERVEPLPYVGMPSYPYETFSEAPHPPEYLRMYQTRRMDPDAFRNVLQQSLKREVAADKLSPTGR